MVGMVIGSWATNEVMSSQSGDVDLLTIQWSMITEALNDSHHEKGVHAYGGILGALRQSVHHSISAHLMSRARKPHDFPALPSGTSAEEAYPLLFAICDPCYL